MDPKEREELKEEILVELQERLKGVVIREDTQAALKETREKWFKDAGMWPARSPMYEVFGNVVFWTVWELIRKLTCLICGVGYVRQLKDHDEANEIADRLCQTVYELRTEYREKRRNHEQNNL